MDEDQEIREFQREYTEFLDDKVSKCYPWLYSEQIVQDDQGLYDAKIRDLIRENQVRLIVNINDLRKKNIRRATKYVSRAADAIIGSF